jgi:hypothetical protein
MPEYVLLLYASEEDEAGERYRDHRRWRVRRLTGLLRRNRRSDSAVPPVIRY